MASLEGRVGGVLFCVIDGDDTAEKIRSRLGTKHSTIMEHLQKLVRLRILDDEKKGRERVYTVKWPALIGMFGTMLVKHQDSVFRSFLESREDADWRDTGGTLYFAGHRIQVRRMTKRGLLKHLESARKIEPIIASNRQVHGLIRAYLRSYARFYDLESENPSFLSCVQKFVDLFSNLVFSDSKVAQLLSAKPKLKERQEFIRFLRFLKDAFISNPGYVAGQFSIRDFLLNRNQGK